MDLHRTGVAQTGFEPVSQAYEARVEPNSTTAQSWYSELNGL